MHTEIKKTADGSTTLYVPELDEHYHSIHGAVQESQHVFIEMGLKAINARELHILEMGFGTGLNALLTLLESGNYDKIWYTTIEKYPLEWEKIKAMQYPESMKLSGELKAKFKLLHTCKWNETQEITPCFQLHKIKTSLHDFDTSLKFNLVYFDAFAPSVQPDLWNLDVFKKLFKCMEPQGILTTYCAKGEVRRTMQAAGFEVERLPGPPGKREMLRAIKPQY